MRCTNGNDFGVAFNFFFAMGTLFYFHHHHERNHPFPFDDDAVSAGNLSMQI